MTTGALIVIGLRIVVPLLIFRHALTGAIAAMLLDALDVVIVDLINLGGFQSNYQTIDKLLDTYYLSIEFIVAFGWENAYARWPALLLFPYRLIGVVLFEVTDVRIMLFVFPNLFENWWLYCVATARFAPSLEPRSLRAVCIVLVLLLIPKMAQEYVLHYREAKPWGWIKDHSPIEV